MAGPYLIVDAANGDVLLQKNAGAPWYSSAAPKLMTLYVAFQELAAGHLSPESAVVFSPRAALMPPTKLGVPQGGSITVDLAVKALVVRSSNDVAVALAEKIAGTEPQFVTRMNATAARLGMAGTTFTDTSGVTNSDHRTTARDVALLTVALERDFPQYASYLLTRDFTYGRRHVELSTNFVGRSTSRADWERSGFLCLSGFEGAASAMRGERRLIAVVFGFRRASLRDEFLLRLYEEAFQLPTSSAPKLTQLRNESGTPTLVFGRGECGQFRYDMPGVAAWLGTYGNWTEAKRIFDDGQAELAAQGAVNLGKEWILPLTVNKAMRQAAIIADLDPGTAQKLCAVYKTKKQFCEVKKAEEITPPFAAFWR